MVIDNLQAWAVGLAVVAALGAALTWLTKNADRIPGAVLSFLAGLVKKHILDRVSPATQRMLRSCARAVFTWAEEELPDIPGQERMDQIVLMLKALPYIGIAFIKHEGKVRVFLQAEWVAWDQEFKRRSANP